ncbi:MAG TPA: SDR family oxidoreductase [Pirellulales bacterium]|jgi:short-subunit dehydrogenase|nr:SDR family oxidoreductase [Pirellulales bacterium]
MAHFSGQSIVITGASSGIGRALTLELAAQKPRLTLAARDKAALDEVAAAAQARGAETCVVSADVEQAADCRRLIETAQEKFGRIDVLVNNAGRAMWSRFDELDDLNVIADLMRVNYLGSVYTTHFALPHLKRSRGLIVAMASVSGLIGVPYLSGYAASKHAVIGFFESLRIELNGSGIDVTILAPDFVRSNILSRAAGPSGQPLEMSPLDQQSLMSAEACARRIVWAMTRRKRLVFTSARSAYARWGQILWPALIDRISAAAVGVRR